MTFTVPTCNLTLNACRLFFRGRPHAGCSRFLLLLHTLLGAGQTGPALEASLAALRPRGRLPPLPYDGTSIRTANGQEQDQVDTPRVTELAFGSAWDMKEEEQHEEDEQGDGDLGDGKGEGGEGMPGNWDALGLEGSRAGTAGQQERNGFGAEAGFVEVEEAGVHPQEEQLEGEEGGQGGRGGQERAAAGLEAAEVQRGWEELEMNERRGLDRGQEPWWDEEERRGMGMGSVAQGRAEEEVALRYGEQVVDVSPEAHRWELGRVWAGRWGHCGRLYGVLCAVHVLPYR